MNVGFIDLQRSVLFNTPL